MNRLSDTTDGPDGAESDPEDPEQLLNDLLGELDNFTGVSFDIICQSCCPKQDIFRFKVRLLQFNSLIKSAK